jgi:hypothetical protein
MLLGLHQLVLTIEPIETAAMLGQILGALTREPLLDLALAALLTWAAHSSVAVMLLLVSLAAGNLITPVAAIALVLGANLGGAIPPVLEAPCTDPAAPRLRSAISPSVPSVALWYCPSRTQSRKHSGQSTKTPLYPSSFAVAWAAHPSIATLAKDAVDHPLGNREFTYLAAAVIGAVFNPWMIFYQQSAIADKKLRPDDRKAARWDTAIGAVLT